MNNPLIQSSSAPHGAIPFDKLSIENLKEAVLAGMEQQDNEINRIIDNPDCPTFYNTILALENSGQLLETATSTLFNLHSAEASEELQELAEILSGPLAEHETNIFMNQKLFERVKSVKENNDQQLNSEQSMLLDRQYEAFEQGGATLDKNKREEYQKTVAKLSELTLLFSKNHLKEKSKYFLEINDKEQLAGLPKSVVTLYRDEAQKRGLKGWVITLDAPSYVPALTYASNREVRQRLYMMQNTLCTHDNENNNFPIVKQIVNLRRHIADLLGYPSYAHYALKRRMAEKPDKVYDMLNMLLAKYKNEAEKDVSEVENMARKTEGENFELQPWDFSYYSNLLRKSLFDFDSETLRPYFKLENVVNGVFSLANKLYGITFKKNLEIPVYNEEVIPYEVFDEDGSFLAILYTDFFPRATKKSGAWMTNFKEQWNDGVVNHRPHVSICMNFPRPSADVPSLLTFGDVSTFLHEFGHALHSIFSQVHYSSLSGTNVYWDFVELPSQLMENFAYEPEFLKTFAFHYMTGEPLPLDLIKKMKAAQNFNVGYSCLRQLSFGYLDMAYYSSACEFVENVPEFEKNIFDNTRLLPYIDGTCMSVQFDHIMAGGYSAGYYSYKWAEILDADAFEVFKNDGVISKKVASSFRKCVLSKGGTQLPMELYTSFSGHVPNADALLRRDGIIKNNSK